jgi:ATP-dependent Clp protease ATP-binding subunit ClpB
MTSNVGSQFIAAANASTDPDEVTRQVNEALRSTFKPEFLNRIDDVVVFHPLALDDIEKIVDIQLKDVRARLANERISLELTPAAVQSLALDGLDPVYGARPLKRLIQRQVVDNVANLIIAGSLAEGDTVRVDVDDDNRFFALKDEEASKASRARAEATVAAESSAADGSDVPIEPDDME